MLRWALCACLVAVLGCDKRSGPADPCELLRAANPHALLRDELSAEQRIYGLCRVESLAAPGGPDEKSAGLEIRRDRAAAAVANFQQFWEHEGAGVGFQGGTREGGVELNGPGVYTVWFPIGGGVQLFSYWEDDHLLVITVKGAPVEIALPWAQDLAGETVRAERASRS